MKRILSLILAATMVLSMTATVFANATVGVLDDPTAVGQTVDGDGDTKYINLDEHYNVVVPTDGAFDFVLDPQGLASIAQGESANFDELEGGKIIGSSVMPIMNNSPQDVIVTVSAKGVTEGGTSGSDPQATFVATEAEVEGDTNNNVLLYLAPSSEDMIGGVEFASGETAYPVDDTTAVEFKFALPKAGFTVSNIGTTEDEYKLEIIEDTGHTTGLKVGGFVNTNADWKNFTQSADPSTVGIQVVFTFAKDAGDDTREFEDGVYGLIKDATRTSIEIAPEYVQPTVTTSSPLTYTKGQADAMVFDVKLGTEALALDLATSKVSYTTSGPYNLPLNDPNVAGLNRITYDAATQKLTVQPAFFALAHTKDVVLTLKFTPKDGATVDDIVITIVKQ